MEIELQTRYTEDMKKAVHSLKKPYRDLRYAVVEYPDFLVVRVYENNIMSFGIDQRVAILEHLELVRKTIESFGVQCELEGVKGDPVGRGI